MQGVTTAKIGRLALCAGKLMLALLVGLCMLLVDLVISAVLGIFEL